MMNSSCPVHRAEADPVPFFSNGDLVFKAHHVGWILSGFFAVISATASFWLIYHHLTYYTNKNQQRYIVRLLLMVPIYGCVSFLSYIWYEQALYFELIRDCYEAVVIASFFYLLLAYLGENERAQKDKMRYKELDKWMWPFGWVKYRPDGLYFLQLQKWGIMQYVFIRPMSTLAAVITHYLGIYCVASYSPIYSHLYLTTAISISVTVAMYCVLQLYVVIAVELKPFSPIIKFLCIKSVVFLTFWQASALAVLSTFGVIKATRYMTADDVLVGLNAILTSFEMVVFGFLHIKAFTYLLYRPEDRTVTTSKWKSLLHALDFRDFGREFSSGSSYMVAKMRGHAPDGPDRDKDFQALTGKRRERETGGPLSAAELARRRVGDEEKWGIGSDGARDDEDDVWDSRINEIGYDDGGPRYHGGGPKRTEGEPDEARIEGLTNWYDARHPRDRNAAELRAKASAQIQPRSDARSAIAKPAPPSPPFWSNYAHSDFDPEVDETLNRRLAASAAQSLAASSSHGHGSPPAGPPLPSPIVLLRPSSPSQSEIDRRHYDGRSRKGPQPKVEDPASMGWWRRLYGGVDDYGGRAEQTHAEDDDGLTAMPPPASRSRRDREGRQAYSALERGEEVRPHRTSDRPSPPNAQPGRPRSLHLAPSIPTGPNAVKVLHSPSPLSPSHSHPSPSDDARAQLTVTPAQERRSVASYVSLESPLDRFSSGSALDRPQSVHRSLENQSDAGTFGPTRPSSPALLAALREQVGSPNSFTTALSSLPPASPAVGGGQSSQEALRRELLPRQDQHQHEHYYEHRQRQPQPQHQPQYMKPPQGPPTPPASHQDQPYRPQPPQQAPFQHPARPPPPPPPAPTRQTSETNRFYVPDSRAIPRKVILPTPLSPARYPVLPAPRPFVPLPPQIQRPARNPERLATHPHPRNQQQQPQSPVQPPLRSPHQPHLQPQTQVARGPNSARINRWRQDGAQPREEVYDARFPLEERRADGAGATGGPRPAQVGKEGGWW